MQYNASFHGCRNADFQFIFCDSFLNFSPNIDCGYLLESPLRGGSNEYYV